MLTLALLPVPTLLTGTQVYSPSPFIVMLNTPELLLPVRVAIKVEVISMSIRVGICGTVKLHSSIMKHCSIDWSCQQS